MTHALGNHEGDPEEQDSVESSAVDSVEDAEPTAERQKELRAGYGANVAAGNPPYVDVPIRTRGELRWILRERGWPGVIPSSEEGESQIPDAAAPSDSAGPIDLRGADLRGVDLSGASLPGALLEQAALGGASFTDADLSGADLESADLSGGAEIEMTLGIAEFLPSLGDEVTLHVTLSGADLSRATLHSAQLEKANLSGVSLSDADLSDALLWQADLRGAALWNANLKGASLLGANLSAAYLDGADLTGAFLRGANLQRADIREATLDAVDLRGADLRGADLRGARMDARTTLTSVVLDSETQLGDIGWNDAPLTRIDWGQARRLGDERVARRRKAPNRKRKSRAARLMEYQAAVRANRQVATALRNQGVSEQADRFAYRARLLQRRVLWRQGVRYWGAGLGSLFLDLLAGYGYRPWRSFVAYVLVLVGFAATYFTLGQALPEPLTPDGAFIFSMTSFHGRGFFPGGLDLAHPITRLAALEAFVGLIIEVSFIATFTQRFFAR